MSHMLKDVAVFFDDSEEGRHILELAAKLASEQQSRLIGITTTVSADSLPADGFARGDAIGEVIRRHQLIGAPQLVRRGEILQKVAAQYDLDTEFRVIPRVESGVEMALNSLYCDLLVVSHPDAPGAPFAWSSADALTLTGVPILMIPRAWKGPAVARRVTVAWNASRQARRALADALPILIAAELVVLLIVDPQRKTDWHGEEPGADMAAYLARHGVRVELRRIESQGQPAGEAIVAHALGENSDLIVFGAYSRPRISEAILGGVTRALLEEVPLPLFVSH